MEKPRSHLRAAGTWAMNRALNSPGAQTRRADTQPLRLPVDQHSNALKIREKTTSRLHVRVADRVPVAWSFATDIALPSHARILQTKQPAF